MNVSVNRYRSDWKRNPTVLRDRLDAQFGTYCGSISCGIFKLVILTWVLFIIKYKDSVFDWPYML